MAVQGYMFPRKTLAEFGQQQPSADSLGEAEADDQHRYYLKGDCSGKATRASEWICAHLSEEIGIATPVPMAIEMANGDIVFGSRRIVGVADTAITSNYLVSPTLTNQAPGVRGLNGLISSIYALDMFVFNDDRHLGNYLSIDDNGVRRFYAFDFSRALFWSWPWVDFPGPRTNTGIVGRALRHLHGFDQVAADSTLNRLGAVPTSTMEAFINKMPTDWLSVQLRDQFLQSWSGHERQDGLDALRKGMSDGSLL